jgi:hypothetical protein
VVLLSARKDRGNQGGSESLTLHKAVNELIRIFHIYCAVCVKIGTCGVVFTCCCCSALVSLVTNGAGQGRAEQDRAGQDRAGQGRAGQGRAGQGRAVQGRARQVLWLSRG